MKEIAIGIDIGGTNTAIGIVDKEGHIMIKDRIDTPKHGDVDRYINDLSNAIESLMVGVKQLNEQIELIGIGLGAPNGNYYTGNVEYAPNLSFKGVIRFVELLKKRFPEIDNISLTNDANAAAIGEMIYGGAKGMKNFVMFTLGTGIGSGIVVNGDIVYGHDGFAGECGHTVIVPDGRDCGCGSAGHLEAYCSASGIKRTAFELLAFYNATNSPLADIPYNKLTSKDIYDAAMEGDEISKEVFEITGDYLGRAIADTIHHTSPEAFFLFGGPVAAGELLLNPVRKSMEEHLLPIFKNKIELKVSSLKEGDAAILGASALAWQESKKKSK